ncbi:MAG: hypothetical protein WCK90_04310 [archaeon]
MTTKSKFADLDSLIALGRKYNTLMMPGESEKNFRKKLSTIVGLTSKDSLLATEILLGKPYQTFNKEEQGISLAMHALVSGFHRAKAEVEGDSHYNVSFAKFTTLLERKGFEKIFSKPFIGKRKEGNVTEEYTIWADYSRGILASAESYTSDPNEVGLNDAHAYLEISLPVQMEKLGELENELLDPIVSGCRAGLKTDSQGNDIYIIRKDMRDSFIDFLKNVDASGFKTNNPWRMYKEHDLWLINYSESKLGSKTWGKRIESKISQLPEKARKMIGLSK